MKISASLNQEERINFLKENREVIINAIVSYSGKGCLKMVMGSLLDCMSNHIFYDLCSMETKDFDVTERIETIIDELVSPIITDSSLNNFFEEQTKKQMNLLK